eukprot:gene2634-2674_t
MLSAKSRGPSPMSQELALRPLLPTKDMEVSKRFYEALGFRATHSDADICVMKIGGFSMILMRHYAQEWAENQMLQLLVRDVEPWWEEHVDSDRLVSEFGVRAPKPPALQPWGLIVGFIVDPAGVCLHDAPALRHLRMEALRTSPTAFGAHYEEAKALTDEDFRKRIEGAAPGATFGAFDGDALVGMAGVVLETGRNSRHKGFMWGVFVQSRYRGRGLALRLVQAVIEKARGIAVVLNSAVVTDNTRAAALYAGLGFKTYGIERKALCVDGVFYDEALIAMDFTEA